MPASQAALREVQALPVRPRSVIDKPAGHTGAALGLGPAPAPGSDRVARRFGLGLLGTMASIIWMWSLTPPSL